MKKIACLLVRVLSLETPKMTLLSEPKHNFLLNIKSSVCMVGLCKYSLTMALLILQVLFMGQAKCKLYKCKNHTNLEYISTNI